MDGGVSDAPERDANRVPLATGDVEDGAVQADTVEQGAYELIRARLQGQGTELFARAKSLNDAREALFGGTQMAVIGSARVRTENNSVARDIANVGGRLLFGYNVFIGLKSETRVEDVFALYRLQESDGAIDLVSEPLEGTFLDDPQFRRDFEELYSYYKESKLTNLRPVHGKLLAAFQIGRTAAEVRVFRWRFERNGEITYIDNRGERDNVFPPSHGFEWTAVTRDAHVRGSHAHVNIDDEVFVDTLAGNLTVKIENNTEDGLGIYREPVEDPNQSLADAQILWARVGRLVLLKIRPYNEDAWRYLIFNSRTRTVTRMDAVGLACLELPEDHGIIFPGGYYLLSGDHRVFDARTDDLEFQRLIRSPNGEDVLYVFHHLEEGRMMLLSYNVISKTLQNPIHCHGYSFFADGRLVVFQFDGTEATRVHPMQIWQTSYYSDEHAVAAGTSDSFFATIGNAELVRGVSDAFSIHRMIGEATPSVAVYEDLIAATTRMVDVYHWLGHDEVGDLLSAVKQIRGSGELVLGEFEKVETLRRQADESLADGRQRLDDLLRSLRPENWTRLTEYVEGLTRLREQRGHVITLREVRYVDLAGLEAMEAEIIARFDALSGNAVTFLLREDALAPYVHEIESYEEGAEASATRADLQPVDEALTRMGAGLDVLNEVLATLKIEDATQRTEIVQGVSAVYARLNRAKATVGLKRKELGSSETRAEFAAQFMLFSQSVANAIGLCDTPERTDEELTRLLVQLEEFEGRFGEHDEYSAELATKREEVYEAFESRKQSLVEERNRRAQNLARAAERILSGVGRRTQTFADADAQNTYFATDPMVLKLRDIVAQLRSIGDSVRADDLEGNIKSARDQASRSLRDRLDLYEGGGKIIRLGRHRFSVTEQSLDLTILPVDGGLALHLTGTDFMERLDRPELTDHRACWTQELVSESDDVYRGEYLAASILAAADSGRDGMDLDTLRQDALDPERLAAVVRECAAVRYEEGYERGVHDADATAILAKLLELRSQAGLLRFPPAARALAALLWAERQATDLGRNWAITARSLGRLDRLFGRGGDAQPLVEELPAAMGAFAEAHSIPVDATTAELAGRYLLEELARDAPSFATSQRAQTIVTEFLAALEDAGQRHAFEQSLTELEGQLERRYALVGAWLSSFLEGRTARDEAAADVRYLDESVAILITGNRVARTASSATTSARVTGLLGQHRRIHERALNVELDEFLTRLHRFRGIEVPRYQAYRAARHAILEEERHHLRLQEFTAKPLTTFVRNRLINEVYLPIIGDNLAKQMGALGADKRTDLMGILLLISPPGYGKTTLMEYVASRLGLIFMKINCPALGHDVVSIDPIAAPNATARQELEKLNLALEMGNNVMIYLDDIQHSNPEFLQRFISMGDAQRKIEGVWRERARTYDLRGKRVCVVMAGNPYTESGRAFQIPDMLANRADIYNLGDVLGGREEVFATSYIENALTSNPVLAPLATRDLEDLYKFLRIAQGEQLAEADFSHAYSATERKDIITVLGHMQKLQSIVLEVNQQYIGSAAQQDAYRVEPPFKLQGSYRNMNKLAEKVVPIMNDAEIELLIDDHYQGESQTLTTGAEENLLKLAEMRGSLSPSEAARWEEIRRGFRRVTAQGGAEADPVDKVVGQLSDIHESLISLGQGLNTVAESSSASHSAEVEQLARFLTRLQTSLETAQLNVQVVNRPVPGMQQLLTQLTDAYDQTLLPLLSSMHHKLTLDESIWRTAKATHELLTSLDAKLLNESSVTRKRTRPLQPKKPGKKVAPDT